MVRKYLNESAMTRVLKGEPERAQGPKLQQLEKENKQSLIGLQPNVLGNYL